MEYIKIPYDYVIWDITCAGRVYYGVMDDPRYWDLQYTPIARSEYLALSKVVKQNKKLQKAHLKRVRRFKLAKEKLLRNT